MSRKLYLGVGLTRRGSMRSPQNPCAGKRLLAFLTHLLVPAQDVADGVGARERLVNLHARTARVGKNQINTLPLQALHLREIVPHRLRNVGLNAVRGRDVHLLDICTYACCVT